MYNSRNQTKNKFDAQKSTAKIAPVFMKRNGSVPVADIGERLLVGDVVHEENAHGAAVVGGGDGAKPLRAGSVPDLQFAALVIDFNSADLKVGAISCKLITFSIVSKAEQQVCLARAVVSHYQQPDGVVISCVCFSGHWQILVLRGAMVRECEIEV